MSFGQPGLLALLLVVALMALAGWWLLRWRGRARRLFAGPRQAGWRAAPLWPRLSLLIAAGALAVIAAAQPRWGNREVTRERRGVDLVIVLDISQSMQATDVVPNRLGLAQDELVRLVESERGNRIGLVLFAGTAVLRSPLTTDSQAIEQLIRRASQESGLARAGSDIGGALDTAAKVFEGSESNGKAVLLVSDGEDFGKSFAGKAAGLRGKGITVFAAGVGTPQGATLTDLDARGTPRPKLDAQGAPVVTRLDESTLRQVASEGGGRYLSLDGNGSLLGLREDLASLQQTPLGAEAQTVPVERFQVFAGVAALLLLAGWLLPARVGLPLPKLPSKLRLRPHAGVALLLLAIVAGACGGGGSVRDRNAAANQLYDQGRYEEALQAYQELLVKRPDIPELSVNTGNALDKLGRFDRAVTETQRALPPADAALGAITYYDLGNHLLAQDQLDQALDAYRNALLLDPSDQDAKFNLELTLGRLAQRQPQQQPQANAPGQEAGAPDQQGTPAPSPATQPQGTPQQPDSSASQPSQEQVQRELQDALKGIDQDLTYEQAVHILDLLRQQQGTPQPSPRGSSGPDY